MGRNLRYQEALRIIQNEEYLEAADFDMVMNPKKKRRKTERRFRRQSSIFQRQRDVLECSLGTKYSQQFL